MHEIGTAFLGTLPVTIAVIGVWLQNKAKFAAMDQRFTSEFNGIDKKFDDLNSQVRHFVDLHINHEGRIATLEERTKKP